MFCVSVRTPMRAFRYVALLSIGCFACKSESKPPPGGSAAGDDGARRAALLVELAKHVGDRSASERLSLVIPNVTAGAGARAAEAYRDAIEPARNVLVEHGLKAKAVLKHVSGWPGAPIEAHTLGKHPMAAEVAKMVAVGAVRPDGSTPLDLEGDLAPWRDVAAVTVAVGLEQALAGDGALAAWTLAGAVRFTQDLGRGAPVEAAADVAELGREVLAAWRSALARGDDRTLPVAELEGQLAICRQLAATIPSYADVAQAAKRDLAMAVSIVEGATPRPQAFSSASEQRTKAWSAERGGLAGIVKDLESLSAGIDTLRAADGGPASAMIAAVNAEVAKGGRSNDVFDPDVVADMLLWRSDTAATCAVQGALVGRRSAKKLPAALPPTELDPITGGPFEYTIDQLGNAILRSGPVERHRQAARVEISIPGQ